MRLDFNIRNIYYCGIVTIAISVRIREKQDIKASDHKLLTALSGKKNFIFLATTRCSLIVSGSIKE